MLKRHPHPTHNLVFLRSQSEHLDERLRGIWPNQRPYRRYFELLKTAYIEARYSEHYTITAEELDWLQERVEMLLDRVEEICGGCLAGPQPLRHSELVSA